jgi:hypothetical protein
MGAGAGQVVERLFGHVLFKGGGAQQIEEVKKMGRTLVNIRPANISNWGLRLQLAPGTLLDSRDSTQLPEAA